jgi:L-lactate dehydrogenase (cytochrome)
MNIASALDYRIAAKRKLPRFLFDYIDGGSSYRQMLCTRQIH